MKTFKSILLAIILIPSIAVYANSGSPRTDGFYRAQGSGDKVESAKVFWINFTGEVMLLEMYNTEGQKLREYFKYSEYKFFSLKYGPSDGGLKATDKLHEYVINVKGDKITVKNIKGDELPSSFVFVPEATAQAERKGISKLPNVSNQGDDKSSAALEPSPKKKKKRCRKK